MPAVILKAKCHLLQPNYRIIRAQFNLEDRELFGQYVVVNILRENGEFADARPYQIIFNPLFPH